MALENTPSQEQDSRLKEIESWSSSSIPQLKALYQGHKAGGTLTPERGAAIAAVTAKKVNELKSQLTSINSTTALAHEAARMKVDGNVDDDTLRAAGIDKHFDKLAKANYNASRLGAVGDVAGDVAMGLGKEVLALTPYAPLARAVTGDDTLLNSTIVVPFVKGVGGAVVDSVAAPFSEDARKRVVASAEAGARGSANLISQAFTRGMYEDAAKRGDFGPLLFAEMARYEDYQKAVAGRGALAEFSGQSSDLSPKDRARVEVQSMAYDPLNYIPAAASAKVGELAAGAARNAALVAARGASKVPAAAGLLEKAAVVGEKVAGGVARALDTTPKPVGLARPLETLEQAAAAASAKPSVGVFTAPQALGERLVTVGKGMVDKAMAARNASGATGMSGSAIAIGAAMAGVDLGTSLTAGLAASMFSRAAKRRLGVAAIGKATELTGNLLIGTKTSQAAFRMLDDYRLAKSALVNAGVGAAASLPFALLSNDPKEQAQIATTGGTLGGLHGVANTGKALLNGVALKAAGLTPGAKSEPRGIASKPYGLFPEADALHSKADTMLSNAGADYVDSMRTLLGDRAEYYAASSPEDAARLAALMGYKVDGNAQGFFFVRPSDGKRVAVAIVGSESSGHEATHALLSALKADENVAPFIAEAYAAANLALGATNAPAFTTTKREYETLAGRTIEQIIGSNDPVKVRDYLVNEVLAEHGSVLLAGLPAGKLGGDATVTQKLAQGFLKTAENFGGRNVMSGDRTIGTSRTLRYNPQFNVLDALKNVMSAVKLENSPDVAYLVDEAKNTVRNEPDNLRSEGILNPIPRDLYSDANYDPNAPTLAKTAGNVPFGDVDNPLSGYDAGAPSGRVIFPRQEAAPEVTPLTDAVVTPEVAPTPEAAPLADAVVAPEVAPTAETAPLAQPTPPPEANVVTATDGTILGTNAKQVGPIRASRDGKNFAEVEYTGPDGTPARSYVPEENFRRGDNTQAPFTGEVIAPGTVPQIRSTPEARAALAGVGSAPRTSNTTSEAVRSVVEKQAAVPYSERKPFRADYDSAVKPSEGDPTRDVRAEQLANASKLDALGLTNPLRASADKAFIPTTAGKSKNSFFAYNLDKVAANLDRIAVWGSENPKYFESLKTGYDSPTSPKILEDLNTYQNNQANSYAGDGRKLATVTVDKGGAGPIPVNPNYTPTILPKERAQFLNLLMGTYGKGRSATKSFPDVFSTRLAEAMGVGVHLAEGKTATGKPSLTVEANAMAKKLEELGFDPRDLETAFENLRYDRFLTTPEEIKGATLAPAYEQVVQAGLMPAEHSPEGAQYTDSVLAKLRAVTSEGSDGDTFNQDGTQYTGGGLVVPLVSRNFDRNAIKIDDIQAFKDANADKMSPAVKVGVYKFPNSEEMSVDLNIVVDPKNEALARRVGAELGQESLFDLGSFDNVKTGASGKNTLPLNPEQFKRLGDALSKGEYPQDVINEAYAQNPEIAKAIKAETAVKPAALMPALATETPDFKEWSKGAKIIKRDDVKDYNFQTGKPFVAETVHGTGAEVGIDPATGMQKDFKAFDLERGGEKTGAESARMAVFSTDNPDVAVTYASNIGMGGAFKLALKGPEDSVKSTPRFQSLQKDYDAAREATSAAYKARAADVREIFDRDYASKPEINGLLEMFMEQSSKEESLNRIFNVLADGIKPSEEAAKRVEDASAAETRASEALAGYIYDSESSALPQRLIPLAVRMDNPKVFDAQGATPANFQLSERMAQAKAEGHDGVVFRNLKDPDLPATHFASFKPENLKSTISPTFDPANPAAYMPAGKADVQFQRDIPLKGSMKGVLDLVHFSSKALTEVDPNQSFGKGAATAADRQGMNKTFFYTKGTAYEGPIAGRSNVYTARVDGKSIYNYNTDPLDVRSIVNREKRDQAIIDAGFKGYYVETEGFDAVAMFDKVKVNAALRQDVMSKGQMKALGFEPQVRQSEADQIRSEIVKSPEYKKEAARIAKQVGSSTNGAYFDTLLQWVDSKVDASLADGAGALMPAEANVTGDGPLGDATVGLGGAVAGPLAGAEVLRKKPAPKEGTFKTAKIAPNANEGVLREVVPLDDVRYAEIEKSARKSESFRRRIRDLGVKPEKTEVENLKAYNKAYNLALQDSVKRQYKAEGGEMIPVDAPVIILGKSKDTLAQNTLDKNPDALFERLDRANSMVSDDPMRLGDVKGLAELMRIAGIGGPSGVTIPPPSPMLKLMLEKGKSYVAKVTGEYHRDMTVAGTVEAAMSGLDSTVKMRDAIGGRPPPLVTAMHHLWGILSRMLPPTDQEAMWLRLVASPEVRASIQASLEGNFNLSEAQWDQTVQNARLLNPTKRGNNATANANDFYLALTRLNGKWDAMSDAYGLQDSKASGRAFAKLTQENGTLGIRNKVQRFIGLTFGTPGLIMDRWKFVEFFHNLYGPTDGYFKYSETGTPTDPKGIYQTYGKMDSSNHNFSLAFYEMMEIGLQKAIDNSPEIRTLLGKHQNVGGLHWVGWNAIKNEAVGHSSLDLTYDLVKRSKNPTVDDIAALLAEKEYYVEGAVGNRIERYTLPLQK